MTSNEKTIEFVRKNEGRIYGDGAADLLAEIDKALVAHFNGKVGHDASPREAVDVIHGVLKKACEAAGMDPNSETYVAEEGSEGRKTYTVSWESGPYEWAIQGSFVVMNVISRLCEPYYGFDLQLYDVE